MSLSIVLIIIFVLIFIVSVSVKYVLKKKEKAVSLTSSKSKKLSLASIFSSSNINEEMFKSLEEKLIASDAGVTATKEIIIKLRNIIEEKKITSADEAKKELKEILVKSFKEESFNLEGKTIIFVAGVNGVGKTTTIAKLANILKTDNSVLLAACDTFRAAAIEQLETWAKRIDVAIVKGQQAADPASVLFSALEKAKKENIDIVIVDTAGRFHNQDNLVRQLEKMKRIATERFSEYNFIPVLILDANVGHNGIEQAKVFTSSLNIKYAIVAKLDSTAKGGVAISVSHYLDLSIVYGGYGEKLEDFKKFDKVSFIDSIME